MSRRPAPPETGIRPDVALFAPSLVGGGAERVTVQLANGFAQRGLAVDLVLVAVQGPYLADVHPDIRIVDLRSKRALASIGPLIRYLRTATPRALLSVMNHANVVASVACTVARTSTPLILRVQSNMTHSLRNESALRARVLLSLMRFAYRRADSVVAISEGTADDFARLTRYPRERINVIYNPLVSRGLLELAAVQPEHPWISGSTIPVVLGAGRLVKSKDFLTLIRAFALLRARMKCRLVILGDGPLRGELEEQVSALGLFDDIALPGFVRNPFAWMRRASLFVMSSAWEGLGNVLIEAMACGTAVVSTNCHSGPSEILEGGKWGRLVPVGDVAALADAMYDTLNTPQAQNVADRARDFTVEQAIDSYIGVIASLSPRWDTIRTPPYAVPGLTAADPEINND